MRRLGPSSAALGLLGAGYVMFRAGLPGGPHVHTLQETVSCLLAVGVASIALVRFYSRKSNRYLLLGAGFLGTAILDGYHAYATSTFFVRWKRLRRRRSSGPASTTTSVMIMVRSMWSGTCTAAGRSSSSCSTISGT